MNVLEFVAAGGTVRLVGQPLVERLTPRQLRFLFATGAFKAGKAAARNVRLKGGFSHEQMSKAAGEAKAGSPQGMMWQVAGKVAARAAAKLAMQQQLRSYRGAKTGALVALGMRGSARGALEKRQLASVRRGVRLNMRQAVADLKY